MTSPSTSAPILVTGAAGFIGSHVVERLLSLGLRVVGVDNFEPFYAPAVKRSAALHLQSIAPGVFRLIEADISDQHAMEEIFRAVRPSGVIHLAAKAGVRPSIEDPAGYARTNVLGTAVLLNQADRFKCSRVVIASSSSVYGNSPTAPFREDQDVNEPISPYAATKRACELIGHTHWRLTGMPTALLRFFTVYGPRQRPDLAIAKFLARISTDAPIEMFGDGTTSRDYTYVDDIVTGVLAAYERIVSHGYRIWNLGGSQPVSLAHMIATIGTVVGREPRIIRSPMQPGDVERTWADTSRSETELGFRPTVSFEEGVRRQWQWAQGR
jgi:UDP-glucuronate 4-epimerase